MSQPPLPPLWFLDVDGCLSPYGAGEGCDGHLYRHGSGGLSMPYRRAVVARVARLHRSGLVEVRWLTTWAAEEVAEWEQAGLGPFDVAAEQEGPYGWWKANVVHAALAENPTRPVVWTDDDIEVNAHRARRIRKTGGGRLLAVSPDRWVGLSDEDLARIEDWLRARVVITHGETGEPVTRAHLSTLDGPTDESGRDEDLDLG